MGYGKGFTCCHGNSSSETGRQAVRKPLRLPTKATSNCHIIKSAARPTIIQPQQAVETIVAGRGLGLARFAADLKQLRFLSTQFTLITDFRHRDSIAAVTQRYPKKQNTHIYKFKKIRIEIHLPRGSIDNGSTRCSSAEVSHSPSEFILSLALFVCKCHVNFIKIPPIRRRREAAEGERSQAKRE